MFRVFLQNIGHFLQYKYDTVEYAKEAGVATGFQFVVFDQNGEIHYSNVK